MVVTPTASGKTLCYNLPVLNAILQNRSAPRALYLFPTKALSSDQVAELYSPDRGHGRGRQGLYLRRRHRPPRRARAVRTAGHVVVTNPDMLHQGILPNHAKWVQAL